MRTAGFILLIATILFGCKKKTALEKYEDLVAQELASNKKVDSIFWDIRFGMTQKEFFNYCWEMNKKGTITDGTDGKGNMYILYKLKNELPYVASMNFYPKFKDTTITGMKALYHYDGWVPWNKSLSADSLLPNIVNLYKKEYSSGNAFIEMNDKIKGPLYAKVDGNRRIIITKEDEVQVKVEFTDLLMEDKKKQQDAQ
jgi:hypothetical protein